jgi:hypothetical protein
MTEFRERDLTGGMGHRLYAERDLTLLEKEN